MTDNTTMSDSIPQTDSSNDSSIESVHYDDESNERTVHSIDSGTPQDPERGDSYQDIYSPKFDIEVGDTIVAV